MIDQVEQSAETSNSENAGSASDAGKSEYIEPQDYSEQADDADRDCGEEADDPDEEIEVGTRKVVLPKSVAEALKSERMMHADYTQKTQGLAKDRETVTAERDQVQRQAKEHQQYIAEIAKVVGINDQLAEYEKVDWNALIESDPVRAMQLQQQQKTLESQRATAVQEVTNKQHQFALNEQQSTAKQIQEATAYFEREIKGWNEALDTEVHKYTLAQGITNDQVIRMSLNAPAVIKLAHKAMLYDRLVAKQAAPKPPAVDAKPAVRVGSNATVKKDPARMSDKEFAAWRHSQIKNRS